MTETITVMPAEFVAIKAILWWEADMSLRDKLTPLVEVAEAALAMGNEEFFDGALTEMVALLGVTTPEEVFELNDYLDWICRSNFESNIA